MKTIRNEQTARHVAKMNPGMQQICWCQNGDMIFITYCADTRSFNKTIRKAA